MNTLQDIDEALKRVQSGALRTDEFVRAVRSLQAQSGLPARLPPRYADVLGQLLDRLESSALFSEESCSFSQRDLLDGVAQWLHKAHLALTQAETQAQAAGSTRAARAARDA